MIDVPGRLITGKDGDSRTEPPNILIVDDTPANLELLTDMLRGRGYIPRPVPSGKLALAAALADPPDLILLDVMMPEMDGFELCERLKVDGKLKDIPVIFITALTGTEDKLRAFSLGAVDYVTKPFQADEVHARVRTHLRLRKLQLEKEERHQAMLRTALSGFWLADAQGRLLEVNDTYCRMSGYGERELLDMQISDLEATESAVDIRSRIDRIMKEGEDRFESRHRRKDGNLFDVEVSVRYQPTDGDNLFIFMQDISSRKQAEILLRQNLEEKEFLLRELFHRTRNNMQVIMSMLSFEASCIRSAEISAMVQRTNDRIMSMSLIHQKLFEAQDLSRIDLGDYVRDLLKSLMTDKSFAPGRIEVSTLAESISVPIDSAIPCGLLLRELITNAFRHAFPGDRHGTVRIGISRIAGGRIAVEVSDDGIGMPEPFDIRKVESLGFQLIQGMVDQLGGELVLEIGQGLSCRVSFPDAHIVKRI